MLSAALYVATMAGCSEKEFIDGSGGQEVGSKNSKTIPEGYFVATFSPPATTRAEADFGVVTGEDERVFDLRYLIYDAEGNFVRERLIFDDFDNDTSDNIQDWPLDAITDTLPVGHYRAVFVTNTDPDIFRKEEAANMPLPPDLLSDYKLGFDQARLNLPYLLGADDPDFFMDVIEFSHEDPSETVYLQRIVGIFKAYRSLVDVQEGLSMLVDDLIANLASEDLLQKQIAPIVSGTLGAALKPLLGPLTGLLDQLINPLVEAIVGPATTLLHELLLERLISDVGGLLEGNNESGDVTDILDPLLNPWKFAKNVLVTVTNQPTQFGFDMEVKARDPASHTYSLPITEVVTDGEVKHVVITKYLGFVDLDNDNAGEQLMVINSINAAVPGVVGGLLLDDVVEDYLLTGALFDIKDPLEFNAPNNLQAYNEYSVADLGIDDYDKRGDSLAVGVKLLDVLNLDSAVGGGLSAALEVLLETELFPRIGPSLSDVLALAGIDLLDLEIALPVNLPLLNLTNLDVAGSWDPENTLEEP